MSDPIVPVDNISNSYEYGSFTCIAPEYEDPNNYLVNSSYFTSHSPVLPKNSEFMLPGQCLVGMEEYHQVMQNNTVENKSYNKGVLALELMTVATTSVLVGNYLAGVMGGSIALVSGISTIYNSYDHNPTADEVLSYTVKYSQGVLKHATFYEIATHEVARSWFKDNILNEVDDWRLRYLLDLSYFTTGNVISNWAADSLTDIQNELFIDDEASKIKVQLDPFLTKKAPTTAVKRIIKEVVKDLAIFSFMYSVSSVENFEEYLGYRINPSARIASYKSVDDSTVPSALGHFASNVFISSYYNGFDLKNTAMTFAHTVAKYAPEYFLSKYLFKDWSGRWVKYPTIAVTSFTYLAAKILLPNH